MATFEKRTGGWLARVRKGGVSRSMTFATKSEAKAWATRLEAEIQDGKAGVIPDKTFGDLIDRYIESRVRALDGAKQEELRLLRTKQDPIGKVRLRNLDERHVSEWRDRRLTAVKPNSVLREWSTLSRACSLAVREWKWLTKNPFKETEKPTKGEARSRRPTQDEIEKILYACGFSWDETPETAQARVGAAFLFAIETAMRAGEICALRWEDVDLAKGLAHIRAIEKGARKTKKKRQVPLSPEAVRVLRHLPESDRVFGLTAPILDALFRKAKDRVGIVDLHFHDSRREGLTRLAKSVDVMTLAKISGHQDLRILLNVYYAPDMEKVAESLR